jgi:hypothetical protein
MDTPTLSTPSVFRPRPLTAGCRAGRHRPLVPALSAAPLALAGVLILTAALVAPEQPQDQAAICHRHNGPAACRVW